VQNNTGQNAKRKLHVYRVLGDQVLILVDPNRKHGGDIPTGPYEITQVNENGTVKQLKKPKGKGFVLETWNIPEICDHTTKATDHRLVLKKYNLDAFSNRAAAYSPHGETLFAFLSNWSDQNTSFTNNVVFYSTSVYILGASAIHHFYHGFLKAVLQQTTTVRP